MTCAPRWISTAALATALLFTAAHSQTVDTPGVTSPLTPAQILRNYPPDALTGSAVDQPVVLKSQGGMSVRVVKLAEGLSHPNGLVFLPDGQTMLVTERPGRLRVVKNGVLDPTPVAGLPALNNVGLGGLHDLVLHPDFAKNQILYISYTKEREPQRGTTLAIARARYRSGRLTEVRDLLVTDAWESPLGTYGGRMVFGPDGMLYISVGDRDGTTSSDLSSARPQAQNLSSHIGKILRVRDDGRPVPPDNPFVGHPSAKPEIYSFGHRNSYGMAWDPKTGEMWAAEFGPAGGDELNRVLPGHNYGWPLVSMGRHYSGSLVSDRPWYREGMDNPLYFWNPNFNPMNMFFYTGDKFPRLKGSSSNRRRRLEIAQMAIRGDFVRQGDTMLNELNVRFRDIRQGPDGYIYALTEGRLRGPKDTDGMLLRLEPASASSPAGANEKRPPVEVSPD